MPEGYRTNVSDGVRCEGVFENSTTSVAGNPPLGRHRYVTVAPAYLLQPVFWQVTHWQLDWHPECWTASAIRAGTLPGLR